MQWFQGAVFSIIPSVFFHFVSFSSFWKNCFENWDEFCPLFTTKFPYLQPGQRVGFSWLEKILTSNIVCLTLDNKQKSLGFDKRITWLSNDSKISLLPCIVSESWAFLQKPLKNFQEFFYLCFIFIFLFFIFTFFQLATVGKHHAKKALKILFILRGNLIP